MTAIQMQSSENTDGLESVALFDTQNLCLPCQSLVVEQAGCFETAC